MTGLLFDMDGVLFDSEPMHIRAWQMVLDAFGHQQPDHWFQQWIGIPDRQTAAHIYEILEVGTSAEALLEHKRGRYREITTCELSAFAGVGEVLGRLRARNVPLAVATSSPRVEAEYLLGLTGLREFFQAVVAIEDVVNPKPHPDPFRIAAERLGLLPAKCLAVEDSPAGAASAHTAGCTVLGVTSTHSAEQLAVAHHIFPTTVEALAWAERWLEKGLSPSLPS